jgi:hypothetical protein
LGKGSESAFGGAAADAKFYGDLIPRQATGAEAGDLKWIDFDPRTPQCLPLLPRSADTHVDALPDQAAL